jgi:hypothetical protein
MLSIEGMLPRRLWLSGLEIYGEKGRYSGNLKGYIFRDNDYEERLGVDEFISNLRKDKAVRSIFNKIELESSDRKEVEGFKVTHFSIILKN